MTELVPRTRDEPSECTLLGSTTRRDFERFATHLRQVLPSARLEWFNKRQRRAAPLKLLALAAPHPVTRNVLVDGLWGEDSPRSANNALQVHVAALRRALGRDVFVTAYASAWLIVAL